MPRRRSVARYRSFLASGTLPAIGVTGYPPFGDAGMGVSETTVGDRVFMLYDSYMSELAVSEARNHLAEAIEIARTGEPVYVTRRGRRVAVLVDAASYDALVEGAEDALDRAELVAARNEDDYVPWEEVKADLGLR